MELDELIRKFLLAVVIRCTEKEEEKRRNEECAKPVTTAYTA
jgi:hypothetical protein